MAGTLRKIFFLVLIVSVTSLAQDTTVVKFDLVSKKLPFGLSVKIPSAFPKLGVALSGGGARGLAHLGALAALEKAHIPVRLIVGTSMGSIIGGLYSAGYSIAELKKIMFSTDWNKFIQSKEVSRRELYLEQKLTEDRSIVSFRLKGWKPIIPQSINAGQNISNFLNAMVFNAPLHSKDFEKFPIEFKAVATNLVSGKEVVLGKGSLTKALRASSSVSFLLPPVRVDSLLLVDGGLVENLPVKSTLKNGADIVLAINTVSHLRKEKDLKYPWQIAEQIVSIPMEILTSQEKAKADFVVEPELGYRSNTDFSNPKELFKEGFRATEKIIPALQEKFIQKFKEKIGNDSVVKNLSLSENPNAVEKKVFATIEPAKDTTIADLLIALFRSCDFNECQDYSLKIIRSDKKNVLRVTYLLKPTIKNVVISGVGADNYKVINKILGKLKGKAYSSKKIFSALLKVLRYYRSKGLSLADVEKINFRAGVLKLEFNEGIVDTLIITGNQSTQEDVITREFPIEVGKPFNVEALQRGLRNLQATNLFDEEEAELQFKNGKRIIILKLKEKIPLALRFGLRIDNVNYGQLLVDLRNENLFGTGAQLGMIVMLGNRRRGVVFEHKANRIFKTYFTYKLKFYRHFQDVFSYANDVPTSKRKFSRSITGEYRQVFTGVSLGFGTQTKKFGNLIVEGRYEENEIKNKANYRGETYKLNIAALRLNLNIDSQDRYPFPHEGFVVNSYYEVALSQLGSDVGYTKFSLDYKSYFSPIEWATVSTRFRFGYSDATLPLSQQFSIGGEESFFGMRDFEFRGRQIFAGSFGYRIKMPFQVFFDTYLKMRYDIGSIWAQREAIRLKDLRHGLGASLMLDTPIGPASFSVGKSFILKNLTGDNLVSWGPFYFYFSVGISY